MRFKLRFERSLHGLEVGAAVEFSSIKIGRVVSVDLDYSPQGYRFPSVVDIEVYPNRLGNVLSKLPKQNRGTEQRRRRLPAIWWSTACALRPRRATCSPGSFISRWIFVPNAARVPFDIHARPLVLPTINGGFDRLQEQIASIVSKVDKMPLASIAQNLNATLAGVDNSLKQVNGQTLPAANQLLRQMSQTAQTAQDLLAEDSPLMLTFSQSLQEALRALRAVRNPLTNLIATPSRCCKAELRSSAQSVQP